MYRALLVFCAIITLSGGALAEEQLAGMMMAGMLRGGPGAVVIVDIQPHSASILDNTATTVPFICKMSDNSTCPPPGGGYVWSFSGQPSFGSINPNTGVATFGPAPLPDCTPSQDNCTFAVSISPSVAVPTIVSITPTSLNNIPSTTVVGTLYQFQCHMSDSSPCLNKLWSFTNVPSFLQPGTNSTGGTLTTTQLPPLTVASGTLQAIVQESVSGFVRHINVAPFTGSGTSFTSPTFTAISPGDAVVGFVRHNNGSGNLSITFGGASCSMKGPQAFSGTMNVSMFVCINVTGSPTTLTLTTANSISSLGGAQTSRLVMDEFANLSTLDAAAGPNYAASPNPSISISPTTANSVVWTMCSCVSPGPGPGSITGVPTGFTFSDNNSDSDATYTAYQMGVVAGPMTIAWPGPSTAGGDIGAVSLH